MPEPRERQNLNVAAERSILAAVHLPDSVFDERDPLGELRSLAESAGAIPVGEIIQNRATPEAGTYMGRGKLEELKAMADELGATVVIFDHELSPKQIAAIEEIVGRKILDRSELILDIFAQRATTAEAKLAVEYAQLEYTYPRLRAMWTHLERIVGAGGIAGVGTRGPGEQQLEIDRRLVQKRKTVLRRELERIHERKSREVFARNTDFFTVGLVGYTNAGKSTLFNTLTSADTYADDRLFATLSTKTREWHLGGGLSVLLSDTVGFVRDLPHNLIASFRATLEEATRADLLLVVLDVSDPSCQTHAATVRSTLEELFEEVERRERRQGKTYQRPEIVHLLNKVDRLRDHSELLVWERQLPGAIPIAAIQPDGPGHAQLLERVRAATLGPINERVVEVPARESKLIDRLEKRATVLERDYLDGVVRMRCLIGDRELARLRSASPSMRLIASP
jgi:GTP-binding protein HflX